MGIRRRPLDDKIVLSLGSRRAHVARLAAEEAKRLAELSASVKKKRRRLEAKGEAEAEEAFSGMGASVKGRGTAGGG